MCSIKQKRMDYADRNSSKAQILDTKIRILLYELVKLRPHRI
ncbi:hypothetical protein B4Q23_2050 [Lacticaseibacillus paracasei]|nr:hypothetical protein B4Q23_2050 [Lacticaseibacillus paracasei]